MQEGARSQGTRRGMARETRFALALVVLLFSSQPTPAASRALPGAAAVGAASDIPSGPTLRLGVSEPSLRGPASEDVDAGAVRVSSAPAAPTAEPFPAGGAPRVASASRVPSPPPRATVAAVSLECPATWFCYPRLGIRGPMVPYTDCSGASDVGAEIRSFPCLSERYLMAHAYTQFGRITAWRAGDVVVADGGRFTVFGAIAQQSCEPPVVPLAPLSLQTSLSGEPCGPVLVVQAR